MPYLTPEDLPPDFVCRRLLIPASSDWLAIVSGAVTELSKPWNWEQFGSVTVDEALEAMQVMIDDYYAGTCGVDGLAPYWDEPDGSDATGDDEATGFPWYEDLADWVVTAFLAASFTPEAAVQFVTTARQIRLWFRTRDYGAIARIFIDEELVGEVDTYSEEAGLREWFWNIPDTGSEFSALDVPTWTLRIEHSGDANENAVEAPSGYAIELIRKRIQWTLNQEGNIGLSRRYNDDLGTWQVSVDGENWIDNPEADPRYINQLPPYGERCDSAATMVALLRMLIENLIEQLTLGRDVTFITALFLQILVLIGWIAFFVSLIVLAVAAALALGVEALETAFTETVWDDLVCIIYCNLDSQGTLSAEGLSNLQDDITAYLPADAAAILNLIINFTGSSALNDARMVVGEQEGECDCVDQFRCAAGCDGLSDPATYEPWQRLGTIPSPIIDSTFGNPLPSMRSSNGLDGATPAVASGVTIELPSVTTVTEVTYDVYISTNFNSCYFIVRLLNSSMTVLATIDGVSGVTQNTWQSRNAIFTATNDVAYIQVGTGQSTAGLAGNHWIDNICWE